jgi:hypothetical protein
MLALAAMALRLHQRLASVSQHYAPQQHPPVN